MRILDATRIDQLATALSDRYGSLATVAAYTGLRLGKLAGLQATDIDMRRRRLAVRSSLIEASGQPPTLGSPRSVAHSLNGRARQTLEWMTPSEKLAEALQ